ncbi:uncharacterized protein LOC116247794 isoform X2 [Nymphaea colorata]|uniref:uncharacterized protein LOC116247794 isoform X2 n=1 Tax=Nymphaea colorata TaxID=210225 RepID=UPI00214EFEE0|nr:uncharacterized protein LOC116247794 isoform X2 [Nymphaea colorata]
MGSLLATAEHHFFRHFPNSPIFGYSMACLVIASPPLSSLSSGPKSVAVLAANPSLPRRSLLRVRCRTNKRLVYASTIFQPTYFSSVSFPFPLRIFNQPSSSSGSALVIAFLLSSVFAALAFVLKSRRKRRISERKIVSSDGNGVQLGPNHAAVSGESLLGVSGARIIFSNDGMQEEEEVTQACDSIGRPRQDSVISSLINSSNAFGRGLGFRESSMLSSPFRETSGSEFGEAGNCIVSRDAASGGISNAMAAHGQLLNEVKKLSKGVPIDKGLIYFQNVVSERFCDDIETAGNDNLSEIDLRLTNDGMEGSEEVVENTSQIVSGDTKVVVDYNSDEISDQLIDEGKEENDMVAEVSGELPISLYEESKMFSCNSEIGDDDITKEIDLWTIHDEKEDRNRPLADDERERSEEFTKRRDTSNAHLHEGSELTIGDAEMKGNVFKQNLPQTMEGETEMRDKTTEASIESIGYHNEEDGHGSMAISNHSSRNPTPVMSFSSEFGVESCLGSSTTDEQSAEGSMFGTLVITGKNRA